MEGPQGHSQRVSQSDTIVEVRCLQIWTRHEGMEGRERGSGCLVDEPVSIVGRVVGVTQAVDAVEIWVAFRSRVHHPGQVVQPSHVGNAILNGLTIIVYPLDEHVTRRLVAGLTAAPILVLDVQRSPLHLERKCWPERLLGLAVKVDTQLFQVSRCCQLWIDARGGVL